MNDPDDSGPVAGDPAAVAETLQRHLDAESDTERVGELQPVVEAVAGWRDAASVAPADWLAALEATPDVLYLRTDDGVLRHRPDVTGDLDPEPFRFAAGSTGDAGDASEGGEALPLGSDEAVERLDGASVTIGVVADLPVAVRARFADENES